MQVNAALHNAACNDELKRNSSKYRLRVTVVQGNAALHKAAWNGYSETVQQLVMHSANTQLCNKASPLRIIPEILK